MDVALGTRGNQGLGPGRYSLVQSLDLNPFVDPAAAHPVAGAAAKGILAAPAHLDELEARNTRQEPSGFIQHALGPPQPAGILIRNPGLGLPGFELLHLGQDKIQYVDHLERQRAYKIGIDMLEHVEALRARENHLAGAGALYGIDVAPGQIGQERGAPGPVLVVAAADLVLADCRYDTDPVEESDRRCADPSTLETDVFKHNVQLRQASGEVVDRPSGARPHPPTKP